MLIDLKVHIKEKFGDVHGNVQSFADSRGIDRQQVEYWIKQKFKINTNGDVGRVMPKKEFKVLENGEVFKVFNSKRKKKKFPRLHYKPEV